MGSTLDRPLTEDQKTKILSISSRAHVTSYSASFVYNYGEFRGNPEQLMKDYFDAMLYMSNWGARRLMLRIPRSLINTQASRLYCISEEIDAIMTSNHVIFDFNFHDEDLSEWTEGEGWLDDLIGLREEVLQGDFRVFYLAWLKAIKNALVSGDIDEDTLEPPVPSGLGQLSPALKKFISFLELDEAMLAVSAQKSENLQQKNPLQLEKWIEKLPIKEQHNFLSRLSRGEPNLSIFLNIRLNELDRKAQSRKEAMNTEQRTISELIQSVKKWQKFKKEEEQRKVELERKHKLEELGAKENQMWQKVDSLIEEKKPKSYDMAIVLLRDLQSLAEYRGKLEEFKERIVKIQQSYSNRPGLRDRLHQATLI
jgi:hypothetical protein